MPATSTVTKTKISRRFIVLILLPIRKKVDGFTNIRLHSLQPRHAKQVPLIHQKANGGA